MTVLTSHFDEMIFTFGAGQIGFAGELPLGLPEVASFKATFLVTGYSLFVGVGPRPVAYTHSFYSLEFDTVPEQLMVAHLRERYGAYVDPLRPADKLVQFQCVRVP